MDCPVCGARAFARDYAPPRPYALLLFGGILLLLGRVVLPGLHDSLFAPGFDGVLPRLYYAGVAAVLLGGVDLFLNENRFCVACGFRCRRPRKRMDKKTSDAVAAFRAERPAAARAQAKRPPVAPNQAVAPLIRMLRSKDEARRADAAETLRELTGQSFGPDPDAWEAWWAGREGEHRASRRAQDGGNADA